MAHTVSLSLPIRRIITDYTKELRKRRIAFDRILVFGSHAKGNANVTSDIDVCVVSPSFGNDYHAALIALMSASSDVDGNLDIVPYTPQDLVDKYDPLAAEIRASGIRVT